MVAVDGEYASTGGVCIADGWLVSSPETGLPYRDTPVSIHGPAVADVERAFAGVWDEAGEPLPDGESHPRAERIAPAEEQSVRVIVQEPRKMRTLQMRELLTAGVEKRLWVTDAYFLSAGEASGPLKIMYQVDGSSDLEEAVLEHLEGSRPVRIGNGAAEQLQLDIYGEAMDSIYLADTHGLQVGHEGLTQLADMLNWLCENWNQPEEGIWETRGGRQQFTYGRLMSWVALDRAVRLARHRGRPAVPSRWITERNRIYEEIMERGWNTKREAFIQNYANDVLDASLLLMPLVGFVAPSDPMWLSTLEAIDQELVSDSLVYRYDPSASPDGLRGTEGTFSICTFWYIDALARSGRLEDARLAFEKMSTYANHLGLFSEEIGLTGEALGNFPQAFSHLAHINAALNLDFQLDHGPGRIEAVISVSQLGR